jgi:GAF domain-containing protein
MAMISLHILLICVLVILFREQRSHSAIFKRLLAALQHDRGAENETRLYALLDVTHVMPDATGLEGVLDRATETCAEVFECDAVSIMLLDVENNELVVRSVAGPESKRSILGAHRRMGEGISGWAAKRREALLLGQVCDESRYPGLILASNTISAAMVVPIVLDDVLFGVINISSGSQSVDYDRIAFQALQAFALNLGACIRCARLMDTMRTKIRSLEEHAIVDTI